MQTACSLTLVATPTSSASRVSGERSMKGTDTPYQWTVEHLGRQLYRIDEAAHRRSTAPELNALIQVVKISDDRSTEIAANRPDASRR